MIGRIRRRESFSRLSKDGTYVRSRGLWCSVVLDSTIECAHVGYAIGRQVGNAVQRNRIRRQLRVLLAARSALLRPGWYLIGVTPAAAGSSWLVLESKVDQLLNQINLRLTTTSSD